MWGRATGGIVREVHGSVERRGARTHRRLSPLPKPAASRPGSVPRFERDFSRHENEEMWELDPECVQAAKAWLSPRPLRSADQPEPVSSSGVGWRFGFRARPAGGNLDPSLGRYGETRPRSRRVRPRASQVTQERPGAAEVYRVETPERPLSRFLRLGWRLGLPQPRRRRRRASRNARPMEPTYSTTTGTANRICEAGSGGVSQAAKMKMSSTP